MNRIGISGFGFVGSAMAKSFQLKGYDLIIYDKYKDNGIGRLEDLLNTNILFLALPTLFDENKKCYDMDPIHDNLHFLQKNKFDGIIVIKSTVEPGSTEIFSKTYDLQIVHNPEFLTARTAFEDFHNQRHIVLGRGSKCSDDGFNQIIDFYKTNYPDAKITTSTSTESESMKLFVNCFYATKVQFFTELYLLSNKLGCDYNKVKDMMLENGWINPMHTTIPGPDGNVSYGGMCFPKDTNALIHLMKKMDSPHHVLDAVIEERNDMREK